jgi:hypothetical protein
MQTIKRAQALREMEIKETPDGKQITFSIKFEKKDGTIVFLPKAISTGLKMNMKINRMRGVMAVDDEFNKIGHIYPVHIDNIHELNGNSVIL